MLTARGKRGRLAFTVLFMVALCSSPALAAGAPVSLDSLSIAIMYERSDLGEPTLRIVAEAPADTTLPFELLLPLPAEGTVTTAWELPPDPGTDPIPVEWDITSTDGVPSIALTLTGSRRGSVEVHYPESRVATSGINSSFDTGFDVVLPVPVQNLVSAVAVPDGVEVSQTSSASLFSEGPDGRRYFYAESGPIAAGESVAFSAHVFENWAEDSQPWMLAVVAAIVALLAALPFLVARRRSA